MCSKGKTRATAIVAVAFWLAVWQVASALVNERVLLVGPLAVLTRLAGLAGQGEFWYSILNTLKRIALGFLLSVLTGIILAILAYRNRGVKALLSPLVKTIKTIPVASFIILLLIWIPSRNLAIATSFLMCFPLVYANVLEGLESTDRQLLEMADLFRIPQRKRIASIYLSQVMPFFHSACSLGLGLAWKSGIAAEVIGLPDHTIGDHLYQAKTYLDTADLFAWTLTIALISVLCEHLVLGLFRKLARKLEVAA